MTPAAAMTATVARAAGITMACRRHQRRCGGVRASGGGRSAGGESSRGAADGATPPGGATYWPIAGRVGGLAARRTSTLGGVGGGTGWRMGVVMAPWAAPANSIVVAYRLLGS